MSLQFPFISQNFTSPCDICQFAKQKRLPYCNSNTHSIQIFDLVHVDIWGPYSIPSIHGHKYFLTLVDDFSRFTWIALMKNKSETIKHLQHFIAYDETQFQSKIKIIRSDNSQEFMMHDFYLAKGILHQTTCVESPQQNGIVERKHQHILNVARALFFQSHLPHSLWSYAIAHSIHIINRLPTPLLHNKSPYEILHKQPPILMHLKVFGCLAYASTLHNNRSKFSSRAIKYVFIGYKEGTKGYLLYNLLTNQIFVSRNVVFFEKHFPFSSHSTSPTESLTPLPCYQNNHLTSDHTVINNHAPASDLATPAPDVPGPENSPTAPNDRGPLSISQQLPSPEQQYTSTQQTRHTTSARHRPSYLQDYHSSLTIDTLNHHPSGISTSPSSLYPISSVLSYDKCSPTYKSFCLTVSSIVKPNTYTQASKLECWRNAMTPEINALEQNHTWTLVELPPRKHPIGCKWVYKVKYHADGTNEQYKARLVAKGYTQMEGVDFFDTFSPVAKMTTVKVILAIAGTRNWFLEQLDVNNAFLHGDLHEEVYMKLPPGVSSSIPNQVCKLQKSLYGLKQASRQWYSKLSTALLSLNYIQSAADYSLFTKAEGSYFTAILVYVDDLVLTGNHLDEIKFVKQFLDRQFKIKGLGQLRFLLALKSQGLLLVSLLIRESTHLNSYPMQDF